MKTSFTEVTIPEIQVIYKKGNKKRIFFIKIDIKHAIESLESST